MRTALVIIITVIVVIVGLYVVVNNPPGVKPITIIDNLSLTLIKEDAYTRGHIDGRASFQAEQSDSYKPTYLGVQEENVPMPSQQWREYASCIARNVCPEDNQDTIILTGVTMSCNAYDGDGNNVPVTCQV
jgi:hypothetical protein